MINSSDGYRGPTGLVQELELHDDECVVWRPIFAMLSSRLSIFICVFVYATFKESKGDGLCRTWLER
jgi:hypothetical protein